jgi:hypothetical protein
MHDLSLDKSSSLVSHTNCKQALACFCHKVAGLHTSLCSGMYQGKIASACR